MGGKGGCFIFPESILRSMDVSDMDLLKMIPEIITNEDNSKLNSCPSMKEVNKTVFEWNGDSARSLDELSGLLLSLTWLNLMTEFLGNSWLKFFRRWVLINVLHIWFGGFWPTIGI